MKICLRPIARLSILGLVLGAYSFGAQTASQGTSTTSSTAKAKRNRKSTESTATGTATSAPAASAPAAKSASGAKTNSEPVNNTSDSEIAAAKASGKVWVNTSSGTYHKSGRYYGKTKQGRFMSEDDAKKAGYKPAKSEIGTKKG